MRLIFFKNLHSKHFLRNIHKNVLHKIDIFLILYTKKYFLFPSRGDTKRETLNLYITAFFLKYIVCCISTFTTKLPGCCNVSLTALLNFYMSIKIDIKCFIYENASLFDSDVYFLHTKFEKSTANDLGTIASCRSL